MEKVKEKNPIFISYPYLRELKARYKANTYQTSPAP